MNTAEAREELAALIASRHTLIWIVTDEERRAELAATEVAVAAGYRVRFWDCASGATDLHGEAVEMPGGEPPGMPQAAYTALREAVLAGAAKDHLEEGDTAARPARQRELWVLRDLHCHLEDPDARRGLKNLARDLQSASAGREGRVVIVAPSGEVPRELRALTTVVDWPLPSREELREIVEEAVALNDGRVKLIGTVEDVVEAAAGLAAEDVSNALALSIHRRGAGKIDPAAIADSKRRVISRERVLSWWPPDPRGLDAIGGLERLKSWLSEQAACFEPGAREYGLHAPRGVLLAGVPGCGKSATAKAVPAAWGKLPLLRLDLGSLKGSLVGQSEENIRRALKLADAMGRVVLWIDEVGKALKGAQGPAGDSGVAADALGELLFWMEEHTSEAVVIGTTNEVDLPPEFLSRFSAAFFVDLPHAVERAAVLAVALAERCRKPEDFDLAAAAKATDGFSGRELGKVVHDALLRAWRDGHREPTTADLLAAAGGIIPVSATSETQLAALRAWAKGRALPASEPPAAAPAAAAPPAGSAAARFRRPN